jgi:hypothetical protein
MSNSKAPEAPLDLMNSGRDELIAGKGPVQVVPQTDRKTEQLKPAEPKPGHRCDTAKREIESNSAILRRKDIEQLSQEKPR